VATRSEKSEGDKRAAAKLPELARAGDLVATGQKLQQALAHQRHIMSWLAHSYFGRQGLGQGGGAVGVTVLDARGTPAASSYYRAVAGLTSQNAMRSVVDTYLSQVVQAPEMRVQSSGIGWSKQVSCRKLGRLLSGQFRASELHEQAWLVNRDTCLAPVAGVKVWLDEGYRLRTERVPPNQVIYNPAERRKPRNLYLHMGVPRGELLARCPEKREYLKLGGGAPEYKEDVSFADLDAAYGFQNDVDLLDVWEHWHLGSGTKDDPGFYRLVCGAEDLVKPKPWKHPFFGFIDLRFSESWDSFGGHPLAAQLLPYQSTITRMSRVIDEAQAKACVPRILVPKGTLVQGPTNTIMEKWEYTPGAGGAPQIVPGQALPPEYYNRYEREHQRMHELTGTSTSAATGTTRKGLNSGRAIREDSEVGASRQREHSTRNDRWYERIARAGMALQVEAFKGNPEARAKAPATELINEIKWDEFDDREDEVQIQCMSVAGLPAHPSARLEYVNELVSSELVNKRYAVRLLGHPDTEAIEDLEAAYFDLAAHQVETALYDQRLIPPEPEPPEYLDTLIDIGTKELLKAVRKGAPDTDTERLRRLLAHAKKLRAGVPAAPATTSPTPPALAAAEVPPGPPPDQLPV
jgi:hypothetical protein